MSDKETIDGFLNQARELRQARRFAEAEVFSRRAVEAAVACRWREYEIYTRYWLAMTVSRQARDQDTLDELGILFELVAQARAADIIWPVAAAYNLWVECARALGDVPNDTILARLATADDWLARHGRPAWRASLSKHRAELWVVEKDFAAALECARDAIECKLEAADAPGYSLPALRVTLAKTLSAAGEHAEAASVFRLVAEDEALFPETRCDAFEGLASAAYVCGDFEQALSAAASSVALAQTIDDASHAIALSRQVFIARSVGENGTAKAASNRHLALTENTSPTRRLHALRDAIDVALDADAATEARSLLADYSELLDHIPTGQAPKFERMFRERWSRLASLP